MATKLIYFTINERDEQAEFRNDDTNEEVREIFRSAAEAGQHDILKLYNTRGSIINISAKIEENTPSTRYRLEVVAAYFSGTAIAEELGTDPVLLENRIEEIERSLLQGGSTPDIVYDMQQKVEEFKKKLEGVEHLSWLGLFKDMSSTKLRHFWKKNQSIRQTDEQNEAVYKKFMELCKVQATEKAREYLKKPTFDNWQWEDAEMMFLLRQMYIDLGFLHTFNIEMHTLQCWLYEIYKNYNVVPFHNFKHCFMVAQMMYGLTWLIGLRNYIEDIDILILITSAICHDLNHPGYNNAYQINARTELALRYNDISPLENHHCAIAFEILTNPNFNIFRNLDKNVFKKIREGMIKCILATDMAKHSEILSSFKAAIEKGFDFSNKEQKSLLLIILIKVADISNEARPMQVSEHWAECLLEEFFMQSDMEKLEGLPVAPFMDREKVNKCTSQVGFIKFVLLPLFETLASLFPAIQKDIIEPVREALQYYQKMSDSLEEEAEKRKDSKNLEKIDVHLKRQTKNGLKTNSNS